MKAIRQADCLVQPKHNYGAVSSICCGPYLGAFRQKFHINQINTSTEQQMYSEMICTSMYCVQPWLTLAQYFRVQVAFLHLHFITVWRTRKSQYFISRSPEHEQKNIGR